MMWFHLLFISTLGVLLINCGSSSSSKTSNSSSETSSIQSASKIPGIDNLDLITISNIAAYSSNSVTARTILINMGMTQSASTTFSHGFRSLSNFQYYVRSNTVNAGSNYGIDSYLQTHDVSHRSNGTYFWIDRPSSSYTDANNNNNIAIAGVRVASGKVVDNCNNSITNTAAPTVVAPDPLANHLWHINNTGQRALSASAGKVGADLNITSSATSIANAGDGIIVAIVDNGGELCHPDLAGNVITDGSINFVNHSNDPFHINALAAHGTAMAGIVAAVKNNATGGYGIAYNAKLKFFNYLEAQNSANYAAALGSSSKSQNVDIFNQSFGSGSLNGFEYNLDNASRSDYEYGVTQLRNGLGAIYVKSAGNSFESCFSNSTLSIIQRHIGCINANVDPSHHIPYQIVIGAFNAQDEKSSYSSVGSVLWVSAPGGEDGLIHPALISTDPQSCTAGVNLKLGTSQGENVDGICNYTKSANGTSSAAATASGAIALLLSTPAANGSTNALTWRDVKHILAKTARKIDTSQNTNVNYTIGNSNMTAQYGWQQNAAGYWFHNWYGFGAIDVAAASSMIRTYTPNSLGSFSSTDWFSRSPAQIIPDNNSQGLSDTMTVTNLNGNIEAVVIKVDITHPITHDLHIELSAPSGKKSVVHTLFNRTFANNANFSNWQLLSNAFYGENLNGNWRIRVVDGMGGDVGTLNSWGIKFHYGQHS